MPAPAIRCWPRVSATIAGLARFLPRRMADLGRGLAAAAARRPSRKACSPTPILADTWERLLAEAEAVAGREAQIEAARRGVLQGLRRRGDRPLDARGLRDGCRRRPPQGGADRAGHGRLAGELRGAGDRSTITAGRSGSRASGRRRRRFLQSLRMLEGIGVAEADPKGADFVHLVTEAMKLSFADREAYYGDPGVHRHPGRDAAVARLCRDPPRR